MPKMRNPRISKEQAAIEHERNRLENLRRHENYEVDYTGCQIKNGDKMLDSHEYEVEDGKIWFTVVDKNGLSYQTDEQPYRLLNLTLIQLPEGMPEAEAKRILSTL